MKKEKYEEHSRFLEKCYEEMYDCMRCAAKRTLPAQLAAQVNVLRASLHNWLHSYATTPRTRARNQCLPGAQQLKPVVPTGG